MSKSIFRRVDAAVVVAVALVLAGVTSPTAAVDHPPDTHPVVAESDASIVASQEASVHQLQTMADSKGALGLYLDDSTGQFVVVVPASGVSTFAIADASPSLSVRVESRNIDAPTIKRIEHALEALTPSIKASYGFGFDPETGMVVLTSEAPETAFASVEAAFPGKISFHRGWFRSASWSSDTQPYSGGAYLNGEKLCTSGFALDFNSGGRYMVTAGHCNTNGYATNMGTAWRESPAWPYWDFELIRGRTYRPYIYDTGATTRPVLNAYNPAVGSTYRTTGRTTGFRTDWKLRKLNQTVYYFDIGQTFHNLAEFYKPSSDNHVSPGDSGGPLWYGYDSSPFGAGIRGVISGYGWDLLEGYNSYATQYQSIADYYVAHAALGN